MIFFSSYLTIRVSQILPPLGMFEENVTTLIGNVMTVDQWQSVYDAVIDDQGLERRNEKNHVSAIMPCGVVYGKK